VDNFAFVYAEKDRIIRVKEESTFSELIINLQSAGQLYNDVRNPSLYVELDEGESNITNIEENFNKMLALSNMIGQINPSLVDIRTLVENAPIPGSEKYVEYIDQTLQMQSEASRQQADLDKTHKVLENVKTERGMMTDEEKLRIEAKKVDKGGQS